MKPHNCLNGPIIIPEAYYVMCYFNIKRLIERNLSCNHIHVTTAKVAVLVLHHNVLRSIKTLL